MDQLSEIKSTPDKTKQKLSMTVNLLKQEVKKISEETMKWLNEAISHLKNGNGRQALKILSIPPSNENQLIQNQTLSNPKNPEDEEMTTGIKKSDLGEYPQETNHNLSHNVKKQKQLTENQEIIEDYLLKEKNVEILLSQKDNHQAQLRAIVLMSNSYYFNLKDNKCIKWLTSIDINKISQNLGLNPETLENLRQKLLEENKKFTEISKKKEKVLEDLRKKTVTEEESNLLINQEEQAKTKMYKSYRELMLPIRKAILTSETFPEEYKIDVIKGIKGDDDVLPEENNLLKQTYNSGNEIIRREIAKVVIYNIKHDLNSFDVIPIKDLPNLGLNIDEMFIAVLANNKISPEFLETKFAPAFFPDENPVKVRQCYEVLKKVTKSEDKPDRIFYYPNTKFMNLFIFKNFIDNSENLIPVVELLSNYGFTYLPCDMDGKFYPEYIDKLKKLGKNLKQIESEINSIKKIIPDYQFDIIITTIYRKDIAEKYIIDNPFVIALNQGIGYNIDIKKEIQLFESLEKIVPDHWRGEFISHAIKKISEMIKSENIAPTIKKQVISKINKYVFDPRITPEQIELFATEFFLASLIPENENIETIMKFCKKHADKIALFDDDQLVLGTDNDYVWYKLSLAASDLYRYPIIEGKENVAIAKEKSDLEYACESINYINDPVLKDKAIKKLIHAFTDEEIGDLEKAQIFIKMIQDETIKKEAQLEIELEKERIRLGETTAWKKMEKIKEKSKEHIEALKKTLGYDKDDLEKQSELEKEIKRIKPNFCVTINMPWSNVLKFLKNGRLISIWENDITMKEKKANSPADYKGKRDKIERLLGIKAKGGIKDPHPVYGAAFSPNGRDEYYGGAKMYGECFIVLKNENIKNRTSFVYDDSFNYEYNKFLLDWEGGIEAKAIHNLTNFSSLHGYVEAQINGGITVNDIESINIRSNAISNDILNMIDDLRQKFPNIKINIITVPNT